MSNNVLGASKLVFQIAVFVVDMSNLHIFTLTFWPSTVWSSSGRFNFCRTVAKTFSVYRVLEISRLWWFNLAFASCFCTSRPGLPVPERWFISRPDLSVLGIGSTSLCHTWELDAEFSMWRLSPDTVCWRSEEWHGPNLSLWVDSALLATISPYLSADSNLASGSRCLDEGSHFDATLFRSCFSMITRCVWDQNSNSWHNSSGCMMYPNPAWEIDSRSLFMIPTSLPSISPAQAPSPGSLSCIDLFDMELRLFIERKWLEENIEGFMMLNKRGGWLHSSRVKWPSVDMSASWFLVSMYLIWISGSKLILWREQKIQREISGSNVDSCLIRRISAL